MSCSNCFNGCADTISDQCVRYTGVDIPGLSIHNGDNLLTVENAITDKIIKLMDGSGIIPIIDTIDVCALVHSYMPCCPPFDLNVVLTALIQSICAIDVRLLTAETNISTLQGQMTTLNSDYTIPSCITGTPSSTDTHQIVQVVMNKLCSLDADLHTNYVRIADINTYIAAYITGQPAATKYNTRMIPWVPYPIFLIPAGAFDSNGAGIVGSPWENIYFCNGTSKAGIPDLRGRVVVGSTAMGPSPFDAAINPNTPGNPVWAIGDKNGVNVVPLTLDQMPDHTHVVTINPTTNLTGHVYHISESFNTAGFVDGVFTKFTGQIDGLTPHDTDSGDTSGVYIDVNHTHTNTVTHAGQGVAHPNIQPGIGAYYIMYIP